MSSRRDVIKNVSLVKRIGYFIIKRNVLFVLIAMILISSSLSSRFLTAFNIINLSRQITFIALVSIGMTLSLISGGLDLSVGSLLAVGAVFSAFLTSYNNLFLPIVVPIIITAFLGFLSGLIIAKSKIQPFIVTLTMMLAGRGIALAFSNERPILVNYNLKSFAFLGRGYIKGIPVLVIIVIICYLIIWYILNYTSFGRNVYAVGGNENATKLMGINIQKVKILVYTISGIFAGLAGVLLSARLGAGNPTAGSGYEMDAIASAVIGGTLMVGGYGKITRTLIGAIIIGVISNVLNLIGISSWYQMILKGFIIIIAVLSQNKIKSIQEKF